MSGILRNYLALTTAQKSILAEAMLFLFASKALLLVLPVRRVLRTSLPVRRIAFADDLQLLEMIKWSLHQADRVSFWKNRCLVKSIAGRWMLQRRGISSQIVFGVNQNTRGRLAAHAWLKAGEFEVVDQTEGYRELYAH